MYTVEIESEVTPDVWFQVDDPHIGLEAAFLAATKLAAQFGVKGHLRVCRPRGSFALVV